MAKTRAVTAPRRGDELSKSMPESARSAQQRACNCEPDPFAAAENSDRPVEWSQQNSNVGSGSASDTGADQPSEYVIAAPIGTSEWEYSLSFGGETLRFATVKPLRGLEYLCPGNDLVPTPNSILQRQAVPLKTTVQCPIEYNAPRATTLKRTRSGARVAQQQDTNNVENDQHVCHKPMESMYIGDFQKFARFLSMRFGELKTRPLRPIVTEWVKLVDPERMKVWGKYHKMLPSKAPDKSPPWWPRDVTYNEPSHLNKNELIELAVDIMLQHRAIDEKKRRPENGSWVDKLEKAAMYSVSMTPNDQFSSAKNLRHSELMKARAEHQLLPNLFSVARTYEDHLAFYNLYEETGNKDSGCGRTVSYTHIAPPKKTLSAPRKRRAKNKTAIPPPREETDGNDADNDADNDTESDELVESAATSFSSMKTFESVGKEDSELNWDMSRRPSMAKTTNYPSSYVSSIDTCSPSTTASYAPMAPADAAFKPPGRVPQFHPGQADMTSIFDSRAVSLPPLSETQSRSTCLNSSSAERVPNILHEPSAFNGLPHNDSMCYPSETHTAQFMNAPMPPQYNYAPYQDAMSTNGFPYAFNRQPYQPEELFFPMPSYNGLGFDYMHPGQQS